MKYIKFLIIVCLLVIVCIMTGCKKNVISTPSNITIDEDNNLIWDEVDDAKSYEISMYSVDNSITTTDSTRKCSYSLNELTEGDYEITIKSVAGEKKKKDSELSDILYFHKYYETGCVYSLINNKTEYEITKVGKASGEFTIEDIYRGKAVTQIAKQAFKGSTRITNVTIGANVISIGDNAFYNCSKLEAVTIPTSVTSLGTSCFQSCRKLQSVVIPYSITEIPNFCFAYCRSLTSVTIGENVTTLGESSFQDCSALTNLVIPDSVETIGEYSFSSCTALEEVTIGKNVESIPVNCFYKNTSLTSVNFPSESSLVSLEEYSFFECTALESITLPEGLETIAEYSFYGDSNLNSISIPDSVYSVGSYCFNKSKLYQDQLDAGESFIYADNWLVGCSSTTLAEIKDINTATLKDTIIGIADSVFKRAPLLETVVLPSSFKYIGKYAFFNCPNLWKLSTLDNSIEVIDDYAFAGCVLTTVTFGIGLKRIGNYTFYQNVQLDNNALSPTTWIPESVTSIGTYAFKYTKLWNNPRDDDGIVYAANWVVGYNDSDGTHLGSVTLNFDTKRVAGISDYAFYQCDTLTSIQGLSNCRYIGRAAFYQCSKLSSVSLNRNLTEIRDKTFYQCSSLIKVTLPRTLNSIGDYAFFECSLLSTVDLASTNCVTIGKSAFYKDANIQTLTLSKSLESIGDYAFYKCSSIPSITIPDKVETIGLKAFFKNEALTDLTLGSGLKVIKESAFNSCTNLKEINLPDSLETVGKSAFYKCTNVEKLNLGNGVKTISDYAFYGLEKVTSLQFPKSLTSIGNYTFKGLSELSYVVIPDTIKVIGQHCFYGCSNLTIYTNANSLLGEWHNRFNSSYRPLFWGVELDENNNVISIQISNDLFANKNSNGTFNAPLIEGKEFKCWTDEEGNTYMMEDLKNINKDCKLTALYE